MDRIPKQQAQELFKNYTMFEKKFGDRRGIEDVIVSKRRFQYEEEVKVMSIKIQTNKKKIWRRITKKKTVSTNKLLTSIQALISLIIWYNQIRFFLTKCLWW